MRSLENLETHGVYPTGAKALLHTERNELLADDFFEQSTSLLGGPIGEIVRSQVIPNLENFYGRWHPSGFMVYPLGSHTDLGSLRLHVWPQGLRRREIKGRGHLGEIYDGDIHNHSWNIASLVLGRYKDNFYEVTPVEGINFSDREVAERGLLRVFRVTYSATEPEALRTDGSCVTVEVNLRRDVHDGEFHTIYAGPFHAPTIPVDQLGATLVFNSHRVNSTGPDILIGGSAEPIIGNRVDVSQDEALYAKEQLTQI